MYNFNGILRDTDNLSTKGKAPALNVSTILTDDHIWSLTINDFN